MATVVFTRFARQALVSIGLYIAQTDEEAAFRFVADLERRVTETLGTFPEGGARVQAGLRSLTIRRYTAVYRYDAGTDVVFVLDIVGTGRNWR